MANVLRKAQKAISVYAISDVLGGAYLIPTIAIQPRISHALVAEQAKKSLRPGPVVLDLSMVSSNGSPHAKPIQAAELRKYMRALKDVGMAPVGVTNASEDVKMMAWKICNIPTLIGTRIETIGAEFSTERIEPTNANIEIEEIVEANASTMMELEEDEKDEVEIKVDDSKEINSENIWNGMKIVEGSVRTGQQVYAKDQGLIVLGSVNSGAEVLADGDIHVYGSLKGRALAGIGGNTSAKVVTTELFE